MSNEFIFTMHRVRKVYPPSREVIKSMTLAFLPGAKIGVIGHNGSGKSTLIKIMAGVESEYEGETWHPEEIKISYLPQEPALNPEKDVRGNIEEALVAQRELLLRFEELNNKLATELDADEMEATLAELAEVQDAIDAKNAWEIDRVVETAMQALRCPPPEADVKTLSGGEVRRVALCRVLLEQPDLLLLDEPTNHLDAESVAWLEQYLKSLSGTVISITHDRYFLDNVAGWILEMDRGVGHPFKGNYTGWLEQKELQLAQEDKQMSARRKNLARELEWVRMNPKARRAKSKSRLSAYDKLLAEDAAYAEYEKAPEIGIPAGERLGNDVVIAENLTKGYSGNLLIDNLSFHLPRAGIVGVIGANGTGKTTLLRLIKGEERPDSGSIEIGETVNLAHVDQSRESLNPDKTVWEEISGGRDLIQVGKREVNSRAYVSAFNFKGSDQQKLVGKLSGGERNRVHLAKLLKKGGNLLLLDEPTNDMDVDTLRALEEALVGFAGSAVVVSHDRWFLNRIATHILAFEGDSQVYWFEGNYEAYEAERRERFGEDAATPRRVKYRKLMRE